MRDPKEYQTIPEWFPGTLEELAEDLGNLRYDSLRELYFLLGRKFSQECGKQYTMGNREVALHLEKAAYYTAIAANWIAGAYYLCRDKEDSRESKV